MSLVAQWLEHPPSVWEVTGLTPVGDSDFSFCFLCFLSHAWSFCTFSLGIFPFLPLLEVPAHFPWVWLPSFPLLKFLHNFLLYYSSPVPTWSSCTLSLGITPLLPLLEVPATFLVVLITSEFTLCLLPGPVSWKKRHRWNLCHKNLKEGDSSPRWWCRVHNDWETSIGSIGRSPISHGTSFQLPNSGE